MTPSAPSFWFKAVCVSLLVLQNSALASGPTRQRHHVTRRDRLLTSLDTVLKEQYLTSTTIVLNEVVKLVVAMIMVLVGFRVQRIALADMPRHLISIIFCREGMLMVVPGILYFLMNQLAFVGLENLDASTYSLVSQLKILTTAFFARVLLNKQLQWYQWRALMLLVIGVILVQQQPEKPQVVMMQPTTAGLTQLPPVTTPPALPNSNIAARLLLSDADETSPQAREIRYSSSASINPPHLEPDVTGRLSDTLPTVTTADKSMFQKWKGFLAATVAAVLSGLAGCYMEKMMKGGTLTVWDRNIQLAVYGIVLGIAQIILLSSSADRAYAAKNGWLGGYSVVAVIVVLLNSFGGILVSLVLAYLDNIIRGFATSVAIFITAFVSYTVFHDVQITMVFVCGVMTVLISVFNYNDSMMAPSPPTSPQSLLPTSSSSGSLSVRVPSTARLLAALGPTPEDIELGHHGGLVRSRSQVSMQMTVTPEEEATLLRPSPQGSPK